MFEFIIENLGYILGLGLIPITFPIFDCLFKRTFKGEDKKKEPPKCKNTTVNSTRIYSAKSEKRHDKKN